MTFQTFVWAVDGNTMDAVPLRQMLQGSTLSSQGVVGHLDCQVNATGPPTSGIVITPGQVVVLGQEIANQGSYYGVNIGNDGTLTIAATGGSPRSDMICVQAKDPTFGGSPWGNPASGQILFPVVISNVGGGATTPPGGISAIPLARIDMPASTSVVQQSYIHDLRQVCNPQRSTQMFSQAGPGSQTNTTTSASGINWPPSASWPVQIPNYASYCVVYYSINEAGYVTGAGNGIARGFTSVTIGPTIGTAVELTSLSLYSVNSVNGPGRHVLAGGSTIFITPSIRGTTQNFIMAQQADGSNTGQLYADEGTSTVLILEFYQGAALS